MLFRSGNMILDFAGNVQIDNVNPQVMAIDPNAAIQGAVEIYYNKNEKHFIGYAGVVLKTDALCGEGSQIGRASCRERV